jgi:hypothetical protein
MYWSKVLQKGVAVLRLAGKGLCQAKGYAASCFKAGILKAYWPGNTLAMKYL